ncbi:uncharacterized protein LOC144110540 [Amblyomma americanum]
MRAPSFHFSQLMLAVAVFLISAGDHTCGEERGSSEKGSQIIFSARGNPQSYGRPPPYPGNGGPPHQPPPPYPGLPNVRGGRQHLPEPPQFLPPRVAWRPGPAPRVPGRPREGSPQRVSRPPTAGSPPRPPAGPPRSPPASK